MNEVIESLEVLKQDETLRKKVKEKIDEIMIILEKNEPLAMEKSLSMLEEVSSWDLSSYHRTQIWDVASLLESKK